VSASLAAPWHAHKYKVNGVSVLHTPNSLTIGSSRVTRARPYLTETKTSLIMGSSFFALFCTVSQPASYINDLLQHAEKNTFSAGNLFCLIESPSQKRVDKPTEPSVEDFETGFQGWSTEDLGKWCHEKFNWNNPKSQPPYISDEEFAILDDRTLRDGTVLLVKWDVWTERIDEDDPSDADEAFRKLRGYRTVRAMMRAAPDLMQALPETDLSEAIADMKPEDDGVWRAPQYE